MSLPALEADVLVAGGGAAGLTAAVRLALRGRSVIVASAAATATALSTGRVLLDQDDPAAEEWASFFLAQFRRQGAYYVMSKRPVKAITNLGTIAPQSLTSPLFDWTTGDKDVAVVGLIGNGDLDPDMASLELARSRHRRPRPCWFSPSCSPELDRDGFVEELGSALMNDLPEQTIVLPPLPQRSPYDLLAELRKRSGKRVVEPAAPLSWAGRRFQSLMEGTAGRLGVNLLKDRRLASLHFEGRSAVSAALSSGMREQKVSFRALVLATGGASSGGLVVQGEEIADPLGLFKMGVAKGTGVSSRCLRTALAAGLDSRKGRAMSRQGDLLRNVYVAGSAAKGMSYPLGHGLGDVLLHAWKAAGTVEEML